MAESVEAAMLQMLENNTDRVKDAEAFLQSFLKDAAAPAVLLQLATASENEFVRQMAALFAVRKIWKYFKNLPAAEQEGLKSGLLERMTVEPARLVRRALTE